MKDYGSFILFCLKLSDKAAIIFSFLTFKNCKFNQMFILE